MSWRYSVAEYLSGDETLQRRELEWGVVVREAPGPFYWHQSLVTRLTVLLDSHVRKDRLGVVVVSPIDVVLDASQALIVQPDIVFISTERQSIIRNQIWGAPDLAIEVLSPGTARRDRTKKRTWYRRYGVREYWLVDPRATRVSVYNFAASPRPRHYGLRRRLLSPLLPDLALPVSQIFAA